MQRQVTDKVAFYKSNNFMRSWSAQAGAVCQPEIALSSNRAPPTLRAKPADVPVKKVQKIPDRKRSASDLYLNAITGTMRTADAIAGAVGDFQNWLKSPSPVSSLAPAKPVKTVPPFDIQDIPVAMRALSMPVAADVMDRWFAGQLNYSPSGEDERRGLNQNGVPYPPSMIEKTLVQIEWVLKFARVQKGLKSLIGQIGTANARAAIKKSLLPHQNRRDIWPWLECQQDIERLHREFSIQYTGIESGWSQKIEQLLSRSLYDEGVPDDLTGALGSFNLYAAISYAYFDQKSHSATVTHISVYVKDNYTFTDERGKASQYLGHWNRSHVAIVPVAGAASALNVGWVDYAITQGDIHAKDAVLYPVKNSDFRAWQQKHNQGGDFVIYTNRFPVKLDVPITVNF